ncbi:MAG: MnhB domain-containing protein [Syntrophomonadaceae bacterium]
MCMQELDNDLNAKEPKQGSDIIRKTLVTKLIAFVQLFALYVIIFGEMGPGGGFQGGVVLGASVIIYMLIFGLEKGREKMSRTLSDIFSSTGVMIYGGIGVLCLLAGGKYLEYGALPLGSPAIGNHYGIMGIEIGVGITVAATMIILFSEMAGRD